MQYQRAELPLVLNGTEAARAFFAGCFENCDPENETLWVAHVDDRLRCLHVSGHDGDKAGADFPLRTIISDAAVHGSAGILLAHNHPSGDRRPSDSDREATQKLAMAAEALDCTVLDHFIFARDGVTSFREMGLL